MWTGFKRTVRSGFVGFWRNAFVSLAAVFVMVVTLFVIGSVLFLGQLLDASLSQLKDKVDINVYFVTTAHPDNILGLKASLEALQEVEEIVYVSREDALREFQTKYENNELIIQALDELGDNPLPASLRIRTKETSQYEGIASFLEGKKQEVMAEEPLIDRINYEQNRSAIDRLTAIINAVEKASFITTIVLVAASILITFNTIRLAIYTAREEIMVMRLVGAGNMFIRGPFLLQGLMYGAVAGVLTLLIFYPLTLWLGEGTESYFQLNIFEYYINNFGDVFFVIVGVGILLGVISSGLAIARYLKT